MEFIKPDEKYFDEYLAACREAAENEVKEWMPVTPDRFDSWKESALQVYEMLESGEGLPDGIPRMITYWCIEDNRFVGEIQIRPYMSMEEAKQIGHIGYAVRYSRWKMGYGTKLLIYAVKALRELRIKPICIVCHVDNTGSNKVSQKVGFQLVETRSVGVERENLYIWD